MSGFDISGGPDNLSVVNKLDESRKHAAGCSSEDSHHHALDTAQRIATEAARGLGAIASRGPTRATTIPSDPAKRKTFPVASGVLDYFPDAIAAVAHVSYVGNEQHNPGQPLHWARGKSTDEADTLLRHFLQRGTLDSDGLRHSAKVAWRALALLQKEIEAEHDARCDPLGHLVTTKAKGQMR